MNLISFVLILESVLRHQAVALEHAVQFSTRKLEHVEAPKQWPSLSLYMGVQYHSMFPLETE
jgi:hypothetical protein